MVWHRARSGEWGSTLTVIEDVGSDASGSKSMKGDTLMIGYEAMQLRIAHRKKEGEQENCAAGNKPVIGSKKKKRVNKDKGGKDLDSILEHKSQYLERTPRNF